MEGGRRGQPIFEEALDPLDEGAGRVGRAQERELVALAGVAELCGDVEPVRHRQARNAERGDLLAERRARGVIERPQIRDLGAAEHLHAPRLHEVDEAGHRVPGLLHLGLDDLAAQQARFSGHELEPQLRGLLAKKAIDRKRRPLRSHQ